MSKVILDKIANYIYSELPEPQHTSEVSEVQKKAQMMAEAIVMIIVQEMKPAGTLPPEFKRKAGLITISWHAFEKLMTNHFNLKDYEVVVEEEWDNDSDHLIDISKEDLKGINGSVWDYEKNKLESGNYTNLVQYLLRRYVAEKGLPAGVYNIRVSW